MTAVLAVAYTAVGAVLVLVALAAMLWPAYGPQGLWTVAWLGVTAVVTAGCGVALEWLGKRRREEVPAVSRARDSAKARTWSDAIGDACDAYAAGDDSKLDLALRLVEAAGSRADEPAPDPIMVEVFRYRDGRRDG